MSILSLEVYEGELMGHNVGEGERHSCTSVGI